MRFLVTQPAGSVFWVTREEDTNKMLSCYHPTTLFVGENGKQLNHVKLLLFVNLHYRLKSHQVQLILLLTRSGVREQYERDRNSWFMNLCWWIWRCTFWPHASSLGAIYSRDCRRYLRIKVTVRDDLKMTQGKWSVGREKMRGCKRILWTKSDQQSQRLAWSDRCNFIHLRGKVTLRIAAKCDSREKMPNEPIRWFNWFRSTNLYHFLHLSSRVNPISSRLNRSHCDSLSLALWKVSSKNALYLSLAGILGLMSLANYRGA